MPDIYITEDEYWPFYDMETEEPYIFCGQHTISDEDFQFIQRAMADFEKAQALLATALEKAHPQEK